MPLKYEKYKPATPKETGDYLYARLKEMGRVYQKKTKCSDYERSRFEYNSVGALLAAVGVKLFTQDDVDKIAENIQDGFTYV